jgi:3-(3-hydroxy-phenyl)propionate hydroxylase
MTTKSRYSVVVVGAGPTGLVLASLLGKYGVDTLLVEANPATVGEPRAVSIDDESLRLVQQMGLLEIVGKDLVSGYGSEYRSPSGRVFLKVKPTEEPYGHPRRNAFRQPIFEAQVRQGLTRYPNVETRFNCRATVVQEAVDGVTVQLETADGKGSEIRGDFLVACDGARSSLREALGYVLSGDSLDERWLIVDLEESPAASPETIVFCNHARPGIALPGPHTTRRYEFKLMPGENDADMLSDETVRALLLSHEADPGSRIVRKTVYQFHARIADHWGRNRIWLAGDAAHLMPPFAGQGMNGCLRDAANLAWKLAEIVSGRFGPQLLDSYERERRGHIREMIQLALRMGAIFAPRSRWHGLATRSAFRALGVWPGARNYFAEMKYKPAPRFSSGFILASPSVRRGLVGRMLPQPKLQKGPHAGMRLDAVLGAGFVLVGVGVDPAVVESLSLGTEWDNILARRVVLRASDVPGLDAEAGRLLLVRPDRYVMASFSPAEAATAAAKLYTLWRNTWPGEPATAEPVVQRVALSG